MTRINPAGWVAGCILLATPALAGPGPYLAIVNEFDAFSQIDQFSVRELERTHRDKEADKFVSDVFRKTYPAFYVKGLREKCQVFERPALCEAEVIRALLKEQHDNTIEEIKRAV